MFSKRSKPKCEIGRPCGFGCVPKNHKCKGILKGAAKIAIQWLTKVTSNLVDRVKSRFTPPKVESVKLPTRSNVFVPDKQKLERLAGDRESLKQKGLLTESVIARLEQAEDMLNGKIPINARKLDENQSDLDLRHKKGEQDLSPEKTEAYINRAREILDSDDTQIFVTAHDYLLNTILKTGLKNAIERKGERKTKDERLKKYLQFRTEIEKKVMGIEDGDPPPGYSRPIYGYIASKADLTNERLITSHDTTDLYGNVKLELIPDTKKRTSFTNGDSMDEEDIHAAVPYDTKSLVPWVYNDYSERYDDDPIGSPPRDIIDLTHGEYLEAQIYGGVSVNDIKAIHYTDKKPTEPIIKTANSLGIEVYFKGEKYGS